MMRWDSRGRPQRGSGNTPGLLGPSFLLPHFTFGLLLSVGPSCARVCTSLQTTKRNFLFAERAMHHYQHPPQ